MTPHRPLTRMTRHTPLDPLDFREQLPGAIPHSILGCDWRIDEMETFACQTANCVG